MTRPARLLLAAILSLFPVLSELRALTIDTFDTPSAVAASEVGSTAIQQVATSSAIGGGRTLRASKSGGDLEVRLETKLGVLFHSQDSDVSGATLTVWDGDTDPGTFNFVGLGAINLLQDGGSAVRLEGISFDYAGNQPISLTFTVYDASDATGARSSSHVVTLSRIYKNETIEIPFTQFTSQGSAGAADFRQAGAISLFISGAGVSSDLNIRGITTNGKCAQVPAGKLPIIDECGRCGGANEDKDSCGVCFGGNSTLDRCGVCGGDGQSCARCEAFDAAALLKELSKYSRSMRQQNLKFSVKISNKTPEVKVEVRDEVQAIYRELVALLQSLPVKFLECTQVAACVESTSHVTTLTSYETTVVRMHTMVKRIIELIKVRHDGGVCEHTPEECRANARKRRREIETYRRTMRTLYKKSIEVIRRVPKVTEVCSG